MSSTPEPSGPMPAGSGSPAGEEPEGDVFSTMEFIAEARRPLLIERHRKIIEEMEAGLSDMLITGDADNQRLSAMLKQLELESERARMLEIMKVLAADPHYKDATLRGALIEELCLLREKKGVEIAALQLLVIGIYRSVRELVTPHQNESPSLADLRELPASYLGRMIHPIAPQFGTPGLAEALVYTPAFSDRCLRTIKRIRRAEKASQTWEDATREPMLSREVEEPLQKLGEEERRETRKLLICDKIRSQFYRDVFLRFLSRDELDPKEVEAHPTLLHWLESIESTAHLYPFMQGQTSAQKAFRLSQLVGKLVQIHEMYARVSLASQHPTYREVFEGKKTRERLLLMSKDHYPVLMVTPELTLSAMLCPFKAFAEWVQRRVSEQDFVLPPDPKR
jgi:hypothetical protein